MEKVLEELRENTVYWIFYQLDGIPYNHGNFN